MSDLDPRDQYKSQYEQQLQAELRHMSTSTQEEVERLRATTRAMYEMESRSLKESRDTAITERDRALAQEAELQTRYHELNDKYVIAYVMDLLTGELFVPCYESVDWLASFVLLRICWLVSVLCLVTDMIIG